MEAPKDVVALFHSAFHPTQGNIVDFSLKIREDVSLDGVEFSSLPSGLHLVDQDVIHFTKDGLCGIAVFRRRRTKEDGLRGVRLGAVGVLIGSAPRARPWLHLPHLKRLAAHLEDTPEDWAPLTEYYESHRQPDIIPAESSVDISDIWNGWEHELATASPNHPLHHLPCLLHAFGPSIMTLFRYVLARRRVLIYTRVPVPQSRSASINSIPMRFSESSRNEEGSRGNSIDQTAAEAGAAPVVEPACVLARVAADICFGWRSETDVPGLGAVESAIPVLGMVGLDAIERLGEESMKRSGWIACTTERIFLEKPYLYDLVVDLSPSLLAHSPTNASPDDKPVLSTSVPAGSSSPSLPQSFKLAPTRPTFSDMRIFEKIDRALYSQPGCSHQHQAQPQHPANQSTASLGIGYGHEDEEGWVVWDRWGCTPNDGMLITGNRQSCAAGMNTGPCSSGLNGHVQGQSEVSESPVSTTTSTTPPASASTGIKFWIDPWRIYEDVCMFCMGVCSWVGLTRPAPTNEGIRLSGPDTTLTRTSQPTARPAPTTHMSADQRRSQRRAHVLELMTIFHKYAAFLHARLGDIVDSHDALPQSPRKAKSSSMSKASFKSAFSKPLLFKEEDRGTLVLTSKDLVALDLSPLSASDAQFVEWLAECLIKSARKSERKVVVKRTWRDMVVAVVGSPW